MNSKILKIIVSAVIIASSLILHDKFYDDNTDSYITAFYMIGDSIASEAELNSSLHDACIYVFNDESEKVVSVSGVTKYVEKIRN